MVVALAWAIDFLCALIPSPFVYGGSISVGMLPIVYYSYRRGTAWGMGAGLVFSGIQMLMGWYVPPANTWWAVVLCVLLDYVLAFTVIGAADLIVFALYPHVFIDWLEQHQHLFKSGALITDVTGVKGCIVDTVQGMLRPDVEFIAAHPMAGRERSGVEYADDKVFQGANFIVTPTEKNTSEAIETCKELGRILGFARIAELTPQKHDEMIAFLSQLTHCIAVTLMTCNDLPSLEEYTGDSFRDLTRIAKINDEMWSELFLLNRDALLTEMDRFSAEFSTLREMLAVGDREGMREMMRRSTERRALFDKPTK